MQPSGYLIGNHSSTRFNSVLEVTDCDLKHADPSDSSLTFLRSHYAISKIGADLTGIIPIGSIESRILFLRGHKVLLDSDLAELYGVETKVLNQAVKRNPERFPLDFMFEINNREVEILRSQFVTSRSGWGGRRSNPYAFTEHGVAMLASVLRSERAIEVNIAIVRAFVRMRAFLSTHQGLAKKMPMLEQKCDSNFQVVFDAIEHLMETGEPKRKRKIGFAKE